jgi:hypothetical protein
MENMIRLNQFVVLIDYSYSYYLIDDDYSYLMDMNQICLIYLNFFLMHVYEDFVDVKQV